MIDVRAIYEGAAEDDEPTSPDDDLLSQLTKWDEFWAVDHNAADWLLEPLIATGRGHALFAPGGTGKSLIALWLAAEAATGGAAFGGYRQNPIDVLYLDYEMTAADLAERLENMGYGPETDLTHLHYALLPSIPALDQPEGGKAVVRLAELVKAQLVVIDTHSRAVQGDENDADTVRAFYRWTGLHLKAAGTAFVRVDHAGKDVDKGQRGSSAKNDDVDIVWQMTQADAGAFTLKTRKRRMGWVPQEVTVTLHDDPVRYTLMTGGGVPAGTKDLMDVLDRLGVPPGASHRASATALRESGRKVQAAVVRAAVKCRREDLMRLVEPPIHNRTSVPESFRHTPNVPDPAHETAHPADSTKPLVNDSGTPSGTLRHTPESKPGVPPLYKSGTPEDQPPEAEFEPLEGLF